MTPRLQHQIELKLAAANLLNQLPSDPTQAKAILRHLNELVDWVAQVDVNDRPKAIAG